MAGKVAQTAAQAGVDVILDVYHAMWHVILGPQNGIFVDSALP